MGKSAAGEGGGTIDCWDSPSLFSLLTSTSTTVDVDERHGRVAAAAEEETGSDDCRGGGEDTAEVANVVSVGLKVKQT